MSVARTAPAQPSTDGPPLDEALRETLAREFHVPAWQVEAIYREELRRLAAAARINTFLGVLATRRVRARLQDALRQASAEALAVARGETASRLAQEGGDDVRRFLRAGQHEEVAVVHHMQPPVRQQPGMDARVDQRQ